MASTDLCKMPFAVSGFTATFYWPESTNVTSYILYRDDTAVYEGMYNFAEDIAISPGNTYSYTMRIRRLDDSLSIASEATVFTSSSAASNIFYCDSIQGRLWLSNYTNSTTRRWIIEPDTPTGISLNVRALENAFFFTENGAD